MKIAYFQPPAAQRIGGLDAAIRGINTALTAAGVEVVDGTDADKSVDLIHLHGLWQPAHARLANSFRKQEIPYIVSPHGMLEPWAWRHKWWKKWPYFQLIEKRYLAGASALFATATSEAERLARFAPRQTIVTLPLGLTGSARPDYHAARQTLGWAPDENVLLYLSRLHVKKGADLLLRALAKIRCPVQTRCVIVGDGDPSFVQRLRSFAHDESNKLPRIDWVGPVWGEGRWKYFQGADLFCLPTHSENFGLAVLDALQVGTPALTTTDTPWRDELAPPRGYITELDVDKLAACLSLYFSQPRTSGSDRKIISAWAHERFAWEQLGVRYAAAMRSLVKH